MAMHCLLIFEFIGTTELLVVLVVALVIFGPRKLPELGRSLGRALGQLQSASDDFKRTWDAESRREPGATLPPAADALAQQPRDAAAPDEAHGPRADAESDAAVEELDAAPEASLVCVQG